MVLVVRVASSLLVVALLGAPVVACPAAVSCLARTVASAPAEVPASRPAGRPAPRWAPRLASTADSTGLEPVASGAGSATQPDPSQLWKDLKDRVYARMPRFDVVPQVTMVISPVVVRGTFDTVPGFGLSTDF